MNNNAGLSTISTSAGALIAAMHGTANGALAVPKPYCDPICLVPDTRVAGTTHVDKINELASGLSAGDRLRLERDAMNHHNQWAIRVLDASNNRIGFVPSDVNEIPARLMDGGKRLYGQVTEVEQRGNWWRIGMGVWLDD